MGQAVAPPKRRRLATYQIVQIVLGILIGGFLVWRVYTRLSVETTGQESTIAIGDFELFNMVPLGLDTWIKLAVSGLIIGSVYALIAIGYTLVYGILRMINFAHSEVFMIGTFAGYFVFEAFAGIDAGADSALAQTFGFVPYDTFVVLFGIATIIVGFAGGVTASMLAGVTLERIAYRPLRRAPRLIPLISAIGASFFLQEAARLMFGPHSRIYDNPTFINRNLGWVLCVGQQNLFWVAAQDVCRDLEGRPVLIPYTGAFTLVLAVILLVVLVTIVQSTRLGRAMRAVAEDKPTAALMGINVDAVISRTFLISGMLAGAAGVMWGIHYGQLDFFVGFIPGIKAFTAAVLGGIGNLPGAMVGALLLGIIEALGPATLGFDLQFKDVIAFSVLVLVLLFRPSGILGEVLTEEKL